ncbi:TPA: hypothetical protein DEO28_02195 [Candidatus Dependentiae bacterium]|nr:MAG: exopolysaccharide biosynthesis protein [candidate division TM6 bacterium GW2011_GWE2_31_21]KKP52545.1 MAG: exopolysaccharide biosynthesis protein [candidate division TM6 bacterium GW2011_GWF2_33_332]HBS48451.1 hypothetical protein [Candidatus Dependentiae bacterium]HBZ73300.1 hypothetical protein [Candidatus Dependentiae bacterium]
MKKVNLIVLSTAFLAIIVLLALQKISLKKETLIDFENNLNYPGLQYKTISQFLPIPLSIHILEIDPRKYKIEIVSGGNEKVGCEKVSSIAQKVNAIAAVNGGFFWYKCFDPKFEGIPLQILKIGNKWYSDPIGDIAIIGWNKEGSEVDLINLLMKWEVKIGNKIYPVNRINKPRGKNRIVLYLPTMGENTLSSKNGTEIIVDNNKVIDIEQKIGNSKIPKNGFVYSVGEWVKTDLSKIKIGDRASFSHEFLTSTADNTQTNSNLFEQWENKEFILGGTPILISNGEISYDFQEDDKFQDPFLLQRHPRTAIGVKPNGNWIFVVVDGRQTMFSVGMSIKELALFMKSLGCSKAINLDGGGSSTFYYKGKIRNNPCGDFGEWHLFKKTNATERAVSDILVVLPREEQKIA